MKDQKWNQKLRMGAEALFLLLVIILVTIITVSIGRDNFLQNIADVAEVARQNAEFYMDIVGPYIMSEEPDADNKASLRDKYEEIYIPEKRKEAMKRRNLAGGKTKEAHAKSIDTTCSNVVKARQWINNAKDLSSLVNLGKFFMEGPYDGWNEATQSQWEDAIQKNPISTLTEENTRLYFHRVNEKVQELL